MTWVLGSTTQHVCHMCVDRRAALSTWHWQTTKKGPKKTKKGWMVDCIVYVRWIQIPHFLLFLNSDLLYCWGSSSVLLPLQCSLWLWLPLISQSHYHYLIWKLLWGPCTEWRSSLIILLTTLQEVIKINYLSLSFSHITLSSYLLLLRLSCKFNIFLGNLNLLWILCTFFFNHLMRVTLNSCHRS